MELDIESGQISLIRVRVVAVVVEFERCYGFPSRCIPWCQVFPLKATPQNIFSCLWWYPAPYFYVLTVLSVDA